MLFRSKRGEEKSVKVAFAGNAVTAPVKAGQQVGTIVVTAGDSQNKVPAVAGVAVEKQPAWKSFLPF